jgi:uncharacterized protein (DUF952 family)
VTVVLPPFAMSKIVYKLFRQSEWQDAQQTGIFSGSADDRRDGFIHLSAPDQLRGTFEKYFAEEPEPVLVAFDAERLGPALKWEISRGGRHFPHFYGVLQINEALSVCRIRREAGRAIFPPEIL